MERNADSSIIGRAESNLYVYLASFDILTEYPHFLTFIEFIDYRALSIIIPRLGHYNRFPFERREFQKMESIHILRPVITEHYSEHINFNVKVF